MMRFTRQTRLFTAALALTFAVAACDDEDSPTQPEAQSITDIVTESASAADPEFSLLLDAVLYVDATNPSSPVVAGLFGDGPLTVFAPTDAAFLALVDAVSGLVDPTVLANDGPFAAIDDLLGAGTVEAVLAYHVTPGRVLAADVLPTGSGARSVSTLLSGASFSVSASGVITAVGNSATIVDTDIEASNGVIHVIDTVILPVEL